MIQNRTVSGEFARSGNPIGPGTVNRTANLPEAVDRELGRLALELDVSKSEVIRRLVAGLVAGAIRTRDLGLVMLVATGLGLVLSAGLRPDTNLLRRQGIRPAARVLRVARPARSGRNNDLNLEDLL